MDIDNDLRSLVNNPFMFDLPRAPRPVGAGAAVAATGSRAYVDDDAFAVAYEEPYAAR
jgi:hypothetical protein